MSTQALPSELVEAIGRYRLAFLITIGPHDGPHTTPQQTILDANRVHLPGIGPTTRRNIAASPAITILWPPATPDGHALILDGIATVSGADLDIRATRAVLHHTVAPESGAARCSGCRRFILDSPDDIAAPGIQPVIMA
ncbi:pyridoxamine 5'-phosphate oxidase family protein [Nocardia sp. NPDC056100]|uniref:pyridoxamine 5'-phosphate oxidase family protein n=1 Tax=Nocardia sp. NPDC056100 TaxID=3345712 RepID=UPI0035DF23CE